MLRTLLYLLWVLHLAIAGNLTAGGFHSCAFSSTVGLKCWGKNDLSQLGDGTTISPRSTPVSASALSVPAFSIKKVSAGETHTCVLVVDGTVRCWGANSWGQLGDGTQSSRSTPYTVPMITNATDISCSFYHTCAALRGGTIMCWGMNDFGQLGDGTVTMRLSPVFVGSMSTAAAVAAGRLFSCALVTGGGVKCWGYNGDGALGDGTNTNRYTPTSVSSISGVTQVAAGWGHVCALLSDTSIRCWGLNSNGQLGDSTVTSKNLPVSPSLTGVTSIGAGLYHSCAALSDTRVKCWGNNAFGQIGDGTSSSRTVPVTVGSVGIEIASISLGYYHSCTLLIDFTVFCWGYNVYGQIGDGTTVTSRSSPVSITLVTPSSQPTNQPSSQPSRQPSAQPTRQPSSQPTRQPTRQPSAQPSTQPTNHPSGQPTRQPSLQPSSMPSRQPSRQPTARPSAQPTWQPSGQPSQQPSGHPTCQPSRQPTSQPSRQPTSHPSRQPTDQPSRQPSRQPSSQPSTQPTGQPTAQPSRDPTDQPSQQPTSRPSNQPTPQPSNQPTACPSRQPTDQPTTRPTTQPTRQPTGQPTVEPSAQPSSRPISCPTSQPSTQPTTSPSLQPSSQPSTSPTGQPSRQPSSIPTSQPTGSPSTQPSTQPSATPSDQPSTLPSSSPSSQPTTQPSQCPAAQPSTSPSTQPSQLPTSQPTRQPTAHPSNDPTSQPSEDPTSQPTRRPTSQPSTRPTLQPVAWPTSQPSCLPTGTPTSQPSTAPSRQPIVAPSAQPSTQPSHSPTTQPSQQPSAQPSMRPSVNPTAQPTHQPSTQPSAEPSTRPTLHPTASPTAQPSIQPTSKPSRQPTSQPTVQPSTQPQSLPTGQPSMQPSTQPSSQPSSQPTRQPTCQPTHQPTSHPTSRSLRFPTSTPVSNIVNVLIDGALQAFNRSVGSTYTSATGGFQLVLAVVKPTSTGSHNGTVSIALPDSRTTVSVSTAISAAGQAAGPVAVVVTTVEIDANRFSSSLASNESSSTTNGSSLAASLPKPKLVSSVVTIQMSQLSQNGSLSATAVPYFETQLAVTRSNSSASLRPAVLVHNCTVGVAETVSVYCADTAVRLNLTCSGRAAALVRRQCPISQAVCSVVDLTDNRIVSSSFCRAVDLGASVVCQCGGNVGANATALASTGRVSVGVFQAYGTGSFTASVALATSLSASDVASKSVTMFASFGCIWGLGLLLLLSLSRDMAAQRKKRQKQQQQLQLLPSTTHKAVLTSAELQQTTEALLRCLLPAYFRVSYHSTTTTTPTGRRFRWWYVMLSCHPYLRMGRALYRCVVRTVTVTTSHREEKEEEEEEENEVEETRWVMLDVIHALTALTMACFLLAVLYDFQYPNDDGSCALQTSVATCESRKMLLDPFQSQCLWRPYASTTDDSGIAITQIVKGRVVETLPIEDTSSVEDDTGRRPCQFNGSNNSSVAFVVSYLITSVFASLLKMFLDRCMGVLMAHSTKAATGDACDNGDNGGNDGESRTAAAAGRRNAAVSGAVAVVPVQEIQPPQQGRHQRLTNEEEQKAREYPVVRVERLLRSLRVATSCSRHDESDVASAMEDGGSPSAYEKRNGDDYDYGSPAEGLRQQRPTLSSMDLAVTMLRLAMADVVGQTRGAAERHVLLLGLYRAFPAVVSLRHVWAWQCLVVLVLVACNGGALYFIVGKAAVRGYGWQVSFLQIAAFEWCSEVLLLQSLEVWLFDYGLCWLVHRDVDAAIRIIARSATASTAVMAVNNDGGVGEGPLSLVMARQWSSLPESRWLQSLWSSLLSTTTVRAMGDDGTSHHHDKRRRIHRRWLRLLARGSQETWEKAVSFVAMLLLAWVVYTYYRFVHRWLFALRSFYFDVTMAGLAAVPVVIVVALVCYCRTRTTADGDSDAGPTEERAVFEEVDNHDDQTLPLKDGDTGTRPPAVVVVVETLASPNPSSLPAVSRPASKPVSRPVSREHRDDAQRRHRQRRPRSAAAVVSNSGPRHSPSKSFARVDVRPASSTVASSSSGSSDDDNDDDGSKGSSSDSFESFDDVSEGKHDDHRGSSDNDSSSGSGGSDGGRFSLNLSWSSFSHSDSDSGSASDDDRESNCGRNGPHRDHGGHS